MRPHFQKSLVFCIGFSLCRSATFLKLKKNIFKDKFNVVVKIVEYLRIIGKLKLLIIEVCQSNINCLYSLAFVSCIFKEYNIKNLYTRSK